MGKLSLKGVKQLAQVTQLLNEGAMIGFQMYVRPELLFLPTEYQFFKT